MNRWLKYYTEEQIARYTDPNNIYAKLNLCYLNDEPVEPEIYDDPAAVYVGKSDQLFECAYLDEYLGIGTIQRENSDQVWRVGVAETVRKLAYIQEQLGKRGIKMLFILTPSKSTLCAPYIPDYYIANRPAARPDYIRPQDMLREELGKTNIHFLDCEQVLKDAGLLAAFPKTGIHWNQLAGFESARAVLQAYTAITGNKTKGFCMTGIDSHADAPSGKINNEKDLYTKLTTGDGNRDGKYNGLAVDPAYYTPAYTVTDTDCAKPKIFWQGCSFSQTMVDLFLKPNGIADIDFVFYTGRNGSLNASDPWKDGVHDPEAWAHWLEGKDMAIFEFVDQQVRFLHCDENTSNADWQTAIGGICGDGNYLQNVVYDSLYLYLKAHEGEY